MTTKKLKLFALGARVVFATAAASVSAQSLPITNGLRLWLKADAGVSTNFAGLVTNWADQSGNGNMATNPTPSAAPIYNLTTNGLTNGLPTLRFNGSQRLDVPDAALVPASTISDLTNDVTIICLKEDDNYTNYECGVTKAYNNFAAPFDYWNQTSQNGNATHFFLSYGAVGAYNLFAPSQTLVPQPGVYQVQSVTYANGSVWEYLNDAVVEFISAGMQADASTNSIWSAPNGAGYPLTVGARFDYGSHLLGNMAEILIYKPALTTSQLMDIVTNYLQPKWNLQFDQPPVVSITSPTNGATAAATSVIPVNISASSPTGMVASVSVYGNGILLTASATANYSVNVSSQTPGPMSLFAVAIDQIGRAATSAPVSITITGPAALSAPPTNNLMVWLDAAYGVATNLDGTVAAWTDESGNGNTATPTNNSPFDTFTGTSYPTVAPEYVANGVNGQHVLHFNGINSVLTVPDSGTAFIAGDFTTFFVVRFSQAWFSFNQMVWSKSSNNLACPFDMRFPSGQTIVYRGDGGVGYADIESAANPGIPLDQFVDLGVVCQAQNIAMYLGGLQYDSGTVVTQIGDGSGSFPLTIGLRDDAGTGLYGDIAEILIYQGAQSAATISNIVTYLNGKYEMTQPYVVVPPPPATPLAPCSRKTGIVISEIMYKPAPRTDSNNVEFLEIYNSCPFFQDISSYQVTCADMNYTFPANTLVPGGAFFVLAASPQGIANVYGLTSNVYGPYNGSLKKSETIELLDEQSNVLLTVPYTDIYPWPVAADGTGHSIVLANPTYGEGDPRAWDISDQVGGSPGQMDAFHPSPLRSVVINEILPHTENPGVSQFIELYNHSTGSVDVSGCILTDDPATNKFVIPAGTVIGPAGFVSFAQSQFSFTLDGEGGTLYFIKPDGSRVLEAVQFGAQADGVSYGRWPDGANDFYAFTTNTPGTNNSTIAIGDIVINELMYDPISGNDDDQYIELYNKGTNTINLSGWQFTAGVNFTFPPNAVLGPNGYIVVGKNTANLFANYTNLNSGNTYGNYSGKLSHSGELVVLSQPESYFGTNTIYVEEDEVTYGTGGRWGEWSSGGGSSLELIDPHSNHRLAANWADSDETQKSSWVDIENTGVLDNGANYDASIDYAQIGLLDAGECLVDNIEVDYNGVNYVSDGTFESGLAGLANWSFQGCMVRSSLENSGYQSSYSLHIRCSDKIWTADNSCQVALNPNPMAAGQTATLRYKARWLRGWPEPLLRLNGNWLEATAAMPVPANLGTPGGHNSQYVTHVGPAMYNVTHTPSVPAANQAVMVTTQAHDSDGIANLTLYYRLDPAANYTAIAMNDNGTGGDAIAGDGVFSATIPGQAANQIAAFYISALDNLGAATRFPALRTNDNEPVRECAIMFGDSNPGGSFGVYHLWITQTNVTRWANLGDLSRDWKNDCTFVNGNRVIYNMDGRFSGSPAHQYYDTPSGNLCSYEWQFKADDMFLGTTDFKKLRAPGVDGDDLSLQREQLACTFLRALGVPWLYKRYAAVYVNGNRRGILMQDEQVPDKDVVAEHFPNDDGGFLYKMQPWWEAAPFLSGYTMNANLASWCNVIPYATTGGVKKMPRYRWNYEIRRTPDSDSDFTNVFSLVDAANSYGAPNYVANMENLANMENWIRVFAADHAAGDWDCFGAADGQNVYGYIGTLGVKYSLFMWDFKTVIGGGVNFPSWTPGQNLFTVNGQDPNTQNMYSNPTFLRMYWRALGELVNGPLNVANSGPLLMAKYNAFIENGLSVENPLAPVASGGMFPGIEPWLSQAQTSIAAQLAAINPSNFSVNPNVTLSNNVAFVTGQAPVNVASVWINGVAYPLTWTSLSNWSVTMPLTNGANYLSVVGVDRGGQPVAGAGNALTVNYSGTIPSPVGQVAINEIMWNPTVTNAAYVELFNNSSNVTCDLSGWQFQGLSYTFPAGSLLPPLSFLILAANAPAFAAAYGATNLVFDTFDSSLSPGQLLSLEQPSGGSNLVVAQVQFDDVPPWPANASIPGVSLQLIDSHQDNWREGNWSTSETNLSSSLWTPDASNSVAESLPPFPPLWINEVEPDNLTGLTNSAGQHAPWLELYNPSTNSVSLTGLYLASDYSNLTDWPFPSGAAISPGQFLVVFADGQTNLSTLSQLHASFALSGGTDSVALSRVFNGQPQVLDYVNYTNLPPNWSYGSLPDGQSFVRVAFYSPTPGASNGNSGTSPSSFIAYSTDGSTYTQSFDSPPDPGAISVDAANPVTINGVTYSLANPFDFAFPVSATGHNGGLGLAAMSGWYGLADPTASVGERFGATDGDQTTGGQISFGLPNSANRALGLLATSSTGYTAIGAKLINNTGAALHYMNLQVTGEIWRQSNVPKTLEFYYWMDPTATAPMSTNATAYLPALNVSFPTVAGDVGGVAVDGTAPANQINLAVTNQPIGSWPTGEALWLVWEMADATGKAQGLAIDNLSFAATALGAPTNTITLSVQGSSANPFVLSWPATASSYQLYSATNLEPPVVWSLVATPAVQSNGTFYLTIPATNATAQFFRLMAP